MGKLTVPDTNDHQHPDVPGFDGPYLLYSNQSHYDYSQHKQLLYWWEVCGHARKHKQAIQWPN
jgi:hypothetical protein